MFVIVIKILFEKNVFNEVVVAHSVTKTHTYIVMTIYHAERLYKFLWHIFLHILVPRIFVVLIVYNIHKKLD